MKKTANQKMIDMGEDSILSSPQYIIFEVKNSMKLSRPVLIASASVITAFVVYRLVDANFERDARRLADKNGITTNAAVNAVAHCYTSARITYALGEPLGAPVASFLGDIREFIDSIFKIFKKNSARDRWKDQWNNAIGRQIGKYANSENVSIKKLVIEACKSNALINFINDQRIDLDKSPAPEWIAPAIITAKQGQDAS